jgi:hypothetical protein
MRSSVTSAEKNHWMVLPTFPLQFWFSCYSQKVPGLLIAVIGGMHVINIASKLLPI